MASFAQPHVTPFACVASQRHPLFALLVFVGVVALGLAVCVAMFDWWSFESSGGCGNALMGRQPFER